jgi:membrane protease YdiL (CAAX protease family)
VAISRGFEPIEPEPSDVVESRGLRSPRIWTALGVGIVGIVLAWLVAASIQEAYAVRQQGPEVLRNRQLMQAWIQEFGKTREGLIMLVVPVQLLFLGLSVLAAWFSPEPTAKRLGLTRGDLPWTAWAAFIVATPIIGVLSSELLSLFVHDLSDPLKLMDLVMATHSVDFLPGLLLLVAVLPGVVEELMFRGYLQTRLIQRWSPAAAIVVSSLIFSLAHLDPLHVFGVMPLGLWLGLVAWRSESVWPAMICHAVNNAVAVVGARYPEAEIMGITMDPVTVLTVIVCSPAMLISLYVLRNP